MRLCALLLALPSVCLAAAELPLDFDTDPGWEPRPTYLGNPAANPTIEVADGALTLGVAEPGKGMKFQLPLSPLPSDLAAYLVVRYRAENLAGGYAFWVYDDSREGLEILNTSELVQDGEWHTVALDLVACGVSGELSSLVTEVQCRQAPARFTLDWMGLADEAPAGAALVPAVSDVAEDLHVGGVDLLPLQPEPTWLASPADAFGSELEDGALHLWAEGAEKGMKFSGRLREPVDLSRYRYVAIRYRARDVAPWGDYFVWLGSGGGGQPEKWAQPALLHELNADDTWQVMIAPLQEGFSASHFALEVSSSARRGDIWLDSIRFSTRRPLIDVADVLPISEGWDDARGEPAAFAPLDLSSLATEDPRQLMTYLGLKSWLPGGRFTTYGIPFETGEQAFAVATPRDIEQVASIPIGQQAAELYILMASKLPARDTGRMGDPLPMTRFSNPERFVFGVHYADGGVEEMIPVELASGENQVRSGPGAYCLTGLRPVVIDKLVLRNRMETGRFLVAAVTLNQGVAATKEPPIPALAPSVPEASAETGRPGIAAAEGGFSVDSGLLRLDLQTEGGIRVRGLENRCTGPVPMELEPGPLFELVAGDRLLTSEEVAVGQAALETAGAVTTLRVPVDGRPGGVPIAGELVMKVGDGPDILMHLDLRHVGETAATLQVNFPLLRGLRLGQAEDTWYLWARKGGIVSNAPTHQRQAYGGQYPLQVADVFSPGAPGGLALLTYDLQNIYRHWDLTKDEAGVTWRMDYWPYEHEPGAIVETAPTALRAHSGDWRRALGDYKQWLGSWYRPLVARKPWFQGVFYYQQTLAWGALRDRQSGTWRMDEVVNEFRDYFDCLDYLHIFDFGQSQVYGRVGDYSHYDELGGLEAMRGAIAQAQEMGVPIGLYIEGYLCDDRGIWGSENAAKYDIRKADGESLLWPGAPTEHMMCPAAEPWRAHLAATYARVAGELEPNGMYIDQYGFLDQWKVCHSTEHGHPAPWPPIRGERDTTRAIREALPPEIANLTEETPNDVNSQYQDGALGYSVTWSDPTLMPHRVDLFRFMFPDFKVLQLVQYNSFTQGAWEMLKYPFFNGEGYWLGGGTTGTYCEDAHQFLKQAFSILNGHEDAFCSEDVEPLVPTLEPTVYANRFTGQRETVWTLLNARFRTFEGDVLTVPHVEGTTYLDAFSGEAIEARIAGGEATLPLRLGPRGVGCIVAQRG